MNLPHIPMSLSFIAPRMRIIKDAMEQRKIVNDLITILGDECFNEIGLPTIERRSTFANKIGNEMTGQLFLLSGMDDLCLRPEGTATLQLLAQGPWKSNRDIKVFYVSRCFRHERPQKGRYREFTQLGVEYLNPQDPKRAEETCIALAERMAAQVLGNNFEVVKNVKRGLTYYTNQEGFEINCSCLGNISQICGGGAYKEGYGFAFGVDRLSLALATMKGTL